MATKSTEDFLYAQTGPIIDVRSPCEFQQGHIPDSLSFPLFSNEERALVGTIYKQKGHDAAVLVGLTIVGPKLAQMATTLKDHMQKANATSCRLLCYRGGMRSASVQWLSEFIGIPCIRLASGYKGYRAHVRELFEKNYQFLLIGGRTGSGKTLLLEQLKNQRFQTIDLESLANHRGSAFGLLPNQHQPTNEQFENRLAHELSLLDSSRPIFIEDESRSIGSCIIPKGLYDQMSISPLIWLDVPQSSRLTRIVEQYGKLPSSWLLECTKRLAKRLGGERVTRICEYIERDLVQEAAQELMIYYDATYDHGRESKKRTVYSSSEENFFTTVRSLYKE